MKRCSWPVFTVLAGLYLSVGVVALLGVSLSVYQGGHWLPLGYCHAVVFAAHSLHMCYCPSSLHTLKETITFPIFFFFGLLFHIKWELCLFRLPLQLNTHVIQARDKMEELFFFQVHLASNLSNKLFYHIVLTLDRRAY